ncbi:hypothetical protein L1D32_04385 [Shewanella insulae]|uniref:hypothetical protein n=1 Tax=Shewanella insulae TaxID=2681496 RepID=UPI001EFDA11E|nr:hypothetical protein [Shewanella insulae]MCG9737397.1 hypothetical protein [Shewanella insulae]MCG9753931.1 hypothetical protein [Shewanella insulae]
MKTNFALLMAGIGLALMSGCASNKSLDQAFYDGVKKSAESRPNNPDNRVEDKDLGGGVVNVIFHGTGKLIHGDGATK